jgi:hypothetical protein
MFSVAVTLLFLGQAMLAVPAGHITGDPAGVAGSAPVSAAPPGEPSCPENLAFWLVNWAHRSGMSPSQKIASTGQTGSRASQLTHSPGWMQSIRSPW